MWDWLEWFLRNLLGGALSATGGFIIAWIVQEYRIRKLRRELTGLRKHRQNEAVLIVSNREDIRPAVERYLQQQKENADCTGDTAEGQNLPQPCAGYTGPRIYHVHRPEPFTESEQEWAAFIERIKREVGKLRQECAPSRILLFTNVPVVLGVFLGAILDNGPEVVVHHYFNGVYRPVGYLAHETVKMG
ncbi:hypothetical protein HRbin36_02615 [bacterium HR36]|nr:hypothetical protein HRbin36_02615 [bacterium HR36]